MRFDSLRNGDTFKCPVTGLTERVTSFHKYANGRWFVRTNNHDHIRPRDFEVELVAWKEHQ